MSRNPEVPSPQPLPPGLYDQVVDGRLDRMLIESRALSLVIDEEEIDEGDSHTVLADHLRRVFREVLAGLTGEDRLARQLELINRILTELEATDSDGDRLLATPPRRLLSVWPREPIGGGVPERPDTPLALGCLLAGTRLDPSLVIAAPQGARLGRPRRHPLLVHQVERHPHPGGRPPRLHRSARSPGCGC